jgi:hypothetical protein
MRAIAGRGCPWKRLTRERTGPLRNLCGLELFFTIHCLAMNFLFAPGARPLNLNGLLRLDIGRGHPHHLLRDSIRFLLVLISRLADRKLGLD